MDRLGQTDVWYKSIVTARNTRFEYSIAPNVPRIRPISQGIDSDAIALIAAAARMDPLNPKRWRLDPQSVDTPEFEGRSVVEIPGAPPSRGSRRAQASRKGRLKNDKSEVRC